MDPLDTFLAEFGDDSMRFRSPADRRAYAVRLTPAGRRLFRRMAATHEKWVVELLDVDSHFREHYLDQEVLERYHAVRILYRVAVDSTGPLTVIDEDGTFRARVAEVATPERVGQAGWLWLHRPVDWAVDPAFQPDAPAAVAPKADRADRDGATRLRRKLAGSGAQIRTLRGLGYLLENRLIIAQQFPEAFRALKEFADLVPDQDDVRLMLADQLVKADRKPEAIEQLQVAYAQCVRDGREADAILRKAGYVEGQNWITRKFEGAEHSEKAWRLRVDQPPSRVVPVLVAGGADRRRALPDDVGEPRLEDRDRLRKAADVAGRGEPVEGGVGVADRLLGGGRPVEEGLVAGAELVEVLDDPTLSGSTWDLTVWYDSPEDASAAVAAIAADPADDLCWPLTTSPAADNLTALRSPMPLTRCSRSLQSL